MDLHSYASSIIELALKKGADSAEVYITGKKTTSIDIKDQKVDFFEQSALSEASLRIIKSGKPAFSYSTIGKETSIPELVNNAIENASFNEPDEHTTFAAATSVSSDLSIEDSSLKDIAEEEKISKAKEIESAALSYDSRISKVRSASYEDMLKETIILNSNGLYAGWKETAVATSITVTAEENGSAEVGSEFDYKRSYSDLNPDKVGKDAAKKAIEMLGAKGIDTKTVPVLLDNGVVVQFLSILAASFKADAVQKGKSMLADKLNTQVASKEISILDNGKLIGGMASAPLDGEGTPSRLTKVIDAGTLSQFLHNRTSASKGGTVSTGNGTRSSFKSPPAVGLTNLYIDNGTSSREELLSSIGEGFLMTEAMGVHTANPISGDFSIGASGIWIDKGMRAFPVKGIAIAGNIANLFNNVDGIGNDLRFFGNLGAPSLRIKSLSISGRG